MAEEKLTTIQVYEKDKDALIERYGGPAREAFSKAVNENCPHPEESRDYMTASVTMPGHDKRQAVGGFYCSACGEYVFKKVRSRQLEPAAS